MIEDCREDFIEKSWIEYRNSVSENLSKSQDDFEKYINIISSGALGLTITFFDHILPIEKAEYTIILILGWILLTLTMLSNLYSHHYSAKISDKTITLIDIKDYDGVVENTTKGNNIISRINKFSILSLFTGILLIVIFVSINFYNMSNEKLNPKPNLVDRPSQIQEKAGRIIPQPPQNRPTVHPPRNNS